MKRKGFTLIELLAVIVILAVIALIATPIILNVIDKAKQGAAESSALGYVEAVENQIMLNEVKGNNQITAGEYTKIDLDNKDVQVKGGSSIKNLKVKVNENGKVEEGIFCINDKSVYYNGKKAEYKKDNDYCSNSSTNGVLSYTANDVSKTYDGNGYGITVTSSGSTIKYGEIEGTYNLNSSPTYINVGTYTVYYEISKEGYTTVRGSKTVTINKAEGSVIAPTAKSLTYTGSAQELINAGSRPTGTIQYKLNDGSYSTSIPTAIEAGTYIVYYKVVGDSNHNDVAERSISVTIIPILKLDIMEQTACPTCGNNAWCKGTTYSTRSQDFDLSIINSIDIPITWTQTSGYKKHSTVTVSLVSKADDTVLITKTSTTGYTGTMSLDVSPYHSNGEGYLKVDYFMKCGHDNDTYHRGKYTIGQINTN